VESPSNPYDSNEVRETEVREWLESLDYVIKHGDDQRVVELLHALQTHAHGQGISINTIAPSDQAPFPGRREIERRIKSIMRWNAMAMVVRANRESDGIGGHISTFASSATLYDVGFNHFFRGPDHECGGDMVYFQGHGSPGVYSRAFLEGRLSAEELTNFRRELAEPRGLSSYPHPWLMPDFWQFPTVSMGLGPIMSIYQARFQEYLMDRGLVPKTDAKVWAFLGDGECDEPETLGAISLAAREQLDNLVFVINCNLQRLDGPVRGNQKIIQELERVFRGAGWNVIKVVWGSEWDSFLADDTEGALVQRLGEIVDGEYQKYTVSDGAYIRKHLFGDDPRLKKFSDRLTDEQLCKIKRGGHDPEKVYAAYHQAMHHKGQPTVIIAKTVKGFGLGESGEGRNITHQQKKLNEDELREFRTRFGIPISDEEVADAPFYRMPEDSEEMIYLQERRKELGGYLPQRREKSEPIEMPAEAVFDEFYEGTKDREVSTTMVIVRIMANLLRDKKLGKLIVPIVPDEARTFGMEALFREVGIYAHAGQQYEPVDSDTLLYYKEAQDGQILEEGITEAGSMSSFIAAGTAYSNYGLNTIPFFIYYSMFGFQRIGDLIWAAGDMRCRGFLIGGTAGRTTLNGEGLQHQDGHSLLLAQTVPNVMAYDPAFGYELAVIVQDGIRRMYVDQEDIFYYLTVENENYPMPAMPKGAKIKEGILKGMYKFKAGNKKAGKLRAQLFGSGAIMNEVLKAQDMLADYGVVADVWSVTSYKELRCEALECERQNTLNPTAKAKTPYITQCLEKESGVFVAASDYMKILPDGISKWVPGPLATLGTDGFGRSESREALRDFFEVDARFVVLATLNELAKAGDMKEADVKKAMKKLGIDGDKPNPVTS
jgi:pyruvate dehydrogenase E1 component